MNQIPPASSILSSTSLPSREQIKDRMMYVPFIFIHYYYYFNYTIHHMQDWVDHASNLPLQIILVFDSLKSYTLICTRTQQHNNYLSPALKPSHPKFQYLQYRDSIILAISLVSECFLKAFITFKKVFGGLKSPRTKL